MLYLHPEPQRMFDSASSSVLIHSRCALVQRQFRLPFLCFATWKENLVATRSPLKLLITVIAVGVAVVSVRGQSQSVLQVRVRWTTAAPAVAPAPGLPQPSPLRLLERQRTGDSLPRQRNPQLSSDQLVVQALNARGDVVDAQLIPDPRLMRVEGTGPSGDLEGVVLQRVDPDFLITLPDSADLVQLRLFQPRWTGTEFTLEPIGSVDLR
jgi:hypothetical protein